jgi:hypothetical protein
MSKKIPELRVQFKKRADGRAVLQCTRRDGTVTWQRHDKHANFFPFHDLRHFAVETTLALRNGFYGLLADGWEIEDTTGKGARGRLSPDSILVEQIVGLLDREQSGGAPPMSAAEFNAQLDTIVGNDPNRPRFTDDQLTRVRNRTQELHNQWAATAADSTLDLTFNRD